MKVVTGTDLVLISRIERLIAASGDRFLTKVFTPAELVDCESESHRLAGRWAAKEAAMKALGQGLDRIEPAAIEIQRGPHGAPLLELRGVARAVAEQAGWTSWSVSISHDGEYATAVVVALTR